MTRPRPARRLLQQVQAAVGWPRTIRVDGTVYRERSGEPISRALSSRGSGSKDYDVRFKTGDRMRIHCTRARIYADLMGDRTPTSIRAIEPMVRPGMRVLICPGGTGTLADRVAHLVGPSGAVVSMERDAESVKFASLRFPRDNVAYEVGATTGIGGETNGAFDAAFISLTDEDVETAFAVVAEAMRIVLDGGWLLIRAEGAQLDEAGRGTPADARALLRRSLATAKDGPTDRVDSVRWLEEASGTPAVLVVIRAAPGQAGDPAGA